ncbi:MAG: MiaB/RimO family radical SAM methylthiotransferase, partial [Alphaproteobacteria bacterium]|nr:MiaB/RimO family radical SAM methylthiotransferase [Alphaproteobacteria bacterium]
KARIIVTGCAATLDPARYAALAEVDLVLDNTAKLRPESYANAPHPGPLPPRGEREDMAQASTRVPSPGLRGEGQGEGQPRARAYLQVQQGCDHRCTFCIIPYARGPSRSVPLEAIIGQARALLASGYREIVLTGVDLTAYGLDLPERPSLGQMVRKLLAALPELPRLRLSSLDPSEIDDDLWHALANQPRLMPHLHLSLQSGDDLILKRMKRRHSRAHAIAAALRARALRPEIALGADLIAGFPTESDEMFRRSLDIVEECGVAFVHAFPYSARPGTPAARMPQLDPALVKERAGRLRAAGAAALEAELARRIGDVSEVLIEAPGRGRADCYAAVGFEAALPTGSIARMRLTGIAGDKLIGVPV